MYFASPLLGSFQGKEKSDWETVWHGVPSTFPSPAIEVSLQRFLTKLGANPLNIPSAKNAKRTCWSLSVTIFTLNLPYKSKIWNETGNMKMRTLGY